MITVSNVSLNFSGEPLFKEVNVKFTEGNCYGVIGANGAGKSTFLKILSGELDSTTGDVSVKPGTRMSVLKQDHFAYESQTILDTIMQGNARLFEIAEEKEALYAKPDFSEEDGNRAAELEAEFAELNGWEAETEAAKLMQGLGLDSRDMYNTMSTLNQTEKVKVLLARALFGAPDMILLDEPTNGLDAKAITWLEDFLIEYEGTVIVVSHDRHFLNNVCTHIVDVDYGKIKMYVGNYDFWYESSQLIQRMLRDQNRKAEEKIKELQGIRRKKKFHGEISLIYLCGYGLGRCWMEIVRTDQLLIPGTQVGVSWVLSVIAVVACGAILISKEVRIRRQAKIQTSIGEVENAEFTEESNGDTSGEDRGEEESAGQQSGEPQGHSQEPEIK